MTKAELAWSVKAFIHQPIIPTKSMRWVVDHKCRFAGTSKNGEYKLYKYKKGLVKVG